MTMNNTENSFLLLQKINWLHAGSYL